MLIGYNRGCSIDDLFLNKSSLFLKILNSRWSMGEVERNHILKLFEKHGLGKDVKILDLGCGNGRISVNLALKGYRVVGVDYSEKFIEDAIHKACEHGVLDKVSFRVGDAREIDRLFDEEEFDVALMYWTTIIGYYEPNTDRVILEKLRKVVKENGYLYILNQASYENVVARIRQCGSPSYYSEIDDEMVLIEKSELLVDKAVIRNTWIFYRKSGKDLEYVDEVCFDLKLYSFHELLELARKAGWSFCRSLW